jgi:hypothetical protein
MNEHRPFDGVAADGVRAVADDDVDAVLLGGLEAVRHRVDVRVDPCADVLQVHDEEVDVAKHVRGRLSGFAVERVHRHAAQRVTRVPGLDHVFLYVGPEAVLRAENGGQPRGALRRRRGQAVGDVAQFAVNRRRVAHDADAAAVQTTRSQEAVGSKRDPHGPDYRGCSTCF